MPRFSVVIPLYNKEKDFPLTLKSVMHQTLTDFEVVIVNDGSTDGSLAIAEAVEDERIKIYNKENEGLAATRNYGVEKATAAHVVFLDADDFWHPFHLENMDAVLNKFPEAPWFATAYEIRHNDKLIRKMVSPVIEMGGDWIGKIENFFEYSMADSLVHPSSFGMKRSFFISLGGHNTAITFAEDTDLWIRAALLKPLAFSTKVSAVIMLNTSNRLNHTTLKSRNYPDFDFYDAEATENPALKKYLDVHRFSIALHYKMDGDLINFKKYRDKIVRSSLNSKQRLLLDLPTTVLNASKTLKGLFHKYGFYFSVYK